MLGQFERILSSSQAERGEATTFLDSSKRTYTRDTWYAREESDFCADDFDEPLEEVRAGPKTRLADVWGHDDTFGEGNYRPMVTEQPGIIDQVRRDIASKALGDAAELGRLHRSAERRHSEATTDDTGRARAAIIHAMAARQSQQLFFSTDYASCVPEAMRGEFLHTLEVETVQMVLGVQLYSLAAGGHVHSRQRDVIREMAAVGCEFVSAESPVLPAPLRRHVMALDAAVYGDESLDGEHAHDDSGEVALRVLVFRIPTANAAYDASNEQEARRRRPRIDDDDEDEEDEEEEVIATDQRDPRGYRVRAIYHLVECSTDDCDEAKDDSLLCFRTFQFSR